MLTRKQRDLLLFIHHRMQQEGIPPSYEEMKNALGLHSKSGIHRLVGALEERGFLKRLPNRARAIEIIRLPEGVGPNAALSDSKVISAPFGKSGPKEVVAGTAVAANINILIHGKIAAGMPIEAVGASRVGFRDDLQATMIERRHQRRSVSLPAPLPISERVHGLAARHRRDSFHDAQRQPQRHNGLVPRSIDQAVEFPLQ